MMRPVLGAAWALAAVAVLSSGSAVAQEGRGFGELRFQYQQGVDGMPLEVIERVRPSFSQELSERVVLSATVEALFHQGRDLQTEFQRTIDESDLGPLLEAAGCTWPEEEGNAALGVARAADYLGVERLYLDFYLPAADVRLGRQAVNWGSAFMVNPTDPFPEVLLTEPWRLRAGVNAARVTVPIGERHQIQAVVGSNDTFTKVRAAARGMVNLGVTDIALVGAYRQEADDGLVGLDVRGTLGVGFWAEGAVHLRSEEKGGIYEDVAVGVDYSFPVLQNLMVSAQYYRNGAGGEGAAPPAASAFSAIEPPDCGDLDLFGTEDAEEADPFAPFFTGRDYAMANVSLGILPELSVAGLWVQNLGDGSALAVPVITALPTGWLEVSAAAQIPLSTWGDGGELHPAEEDLRIDIETGGDPIVVDLSGMVPRATFIVWTRVNF